MYSKMIRPNHFSVCDCECNIYRLMNVIAQMCIYIYILIIVIIIHYQYNKKWKKSDFVRRTRYLYLALEPVEIDLFPLFLDLYALELGFDRFPSLSTLWCLRVLNQKKKKKGVHDLSNKISSTKKERKKEDRVYHIEIFVPVRTAWLEDWEMSGKRVWSNFRLSFFVLFLSLPL